MNRELPRPPARDLAIAGQDWREMLFVHWPVRPDRLRAIVPPTLELDLFDGDAWVTLLPFSAQNSRPFAMPRAFGFDFLEVNLRTYVRHRGEPGIWFFSLDASSRLAVWGARLLYGLPYVHADITTTGPPGRPAWRLERDGGGHLRLDALTVPAELRAPAETLAFFLVERYVLFVQGRRSLLRQQVAHRPYLLGDATVERLDEDLLARAGVPPQVRGPLVAHASPGVDVRFYLPEVMETAHVGADVPIRTPV
jgi:hypothetical protein